MAHSFDFPVFPREADLDAMDKEQLRESLEAVQAQICQLDEAEPEDMESEAYQIWGEAHEELEDQADELLERLERARQTAFGADWFRHDSSERGSRPWSPRHVKQGYRQNELTRILLMSPSWLSLLSI